MKAPGFSALVTGGMIVILAAAWFSVLSGLSIAQSLVPVDPMMQCRAMLELVVKDRANAQIEAAYFAARTNALEAEVKDLQKQVAAQTKTKEQQPKAAQ